MNALSLSFKDTNFQITDIHGQPWLRGLQVASALGYKNPAADIVNLYNRNADEFTDSMTQVIELPTAGGKQQVRVFSLRGCHLLGMLARTKVAKEFRRWVLDVLEDEVSGRLKPQAPRKALPSGLTHEQQAEVKALHNILLQSVPFEKQKALAITLWSAVKSKFKVGYKDVPPEQFPEVLSLMARVAVEKGAQYREAEAVNFETVPKLFERQANIPFNLNRNAHYAVTVKNGRIYRHTVSYATFPYEDNMIPCLAHQG
ncbi:Bro-N domain-containing protein [Neisseria lactamica]|uniref:BRO-N domain-containing protein n=1 Tax=Neisseria lactamica TaxID=486 RepID=UPI000BB5EB7B|nr:Bro-N domain-containing protein [Neisseria lactamica]